MIRGDAILGTLPYRPATGGLPSIVSGWRWPTRKHSTAPRNIWPRSASRRRVSSSHPRRPGAGCSRSAPPRGAGVAGSPTHRMAPGSRRRLARDSWPDLRRRGPSAASPADLQYDPEIVDGQRGPARASASLRRRGVQRRRRSRSSCTAGSASSCASSTRPGRRSPGSGIGAALSSAPRAGVASIEPLGSAAAIRHHHGTGDFIANGVVSHNCFARPTHEFLDFDAGRDFDARSSSRSTRPRSCAPSWRARVAGEHIAMGTNTDLYQWVEGRYKLMRGSGRRCATSPTRSRS